VEDEAVEAIKIDSTLQTAAPPGLLIRSSARTMLAEKSTDYLERN